MYRFTLCMMAAAALAAAGLSQTTNGNSATNTNSSGNSNAQQQATTNSQGSSNYNPASNDMQNSRARNSRDVSTILNCTNEARQDIANGNTDQAKNAVNQAIQAAQSLNSSRGFVPMYEELDQYSVLGPIQASRSQSGSADRSATVGSGTSNSQNESANQSATGQNGSEANSGSQSASQSGPGRHGIAVTHVVGQFTTVGLDANLAKSHLQAARRALDNGDKQAADQALRAVQDGVVMASVASDMPLLRARENLALARMAAKHGEYRQAHTELRAACQALQAYSREGGSHATQAKQLRSEISGYNVNSNQSDAPSRIGSWWNQTAGWFSTVNTNSNTRNRNTD